MARNSSQSTMACKVLQNLEGVLREQRAWTTLPYLISYFYFNAVCARYIFWRGIELIIIINKYFVALFTSLGVIITKLTSYNCLLESLWPLPDEK